MKVAFSAWPYPRWVAHRGAGRHAPENTVAALRFGWASGYRMFEIDARLCADDVLILMHDARLDRTTDGHGRIDRQVWATLAGLDAGRWHSPLWATEAIPTLERAARWVLANDGMLNIELKASRGRERRIGAAVARLAAALWRTASVPPLLSSFSSRALEAARTQAPDLPRALLFDDLPSDWILRCQALGCVAVNAHHRAWSAARIAQAHGASLRALAYTVNDGRRIDELLRMGLDMVITDEVITDEVITDEVMIDPLASDPVGAGGRPPLRPAQTVGGNR